MVVDVVVVGVVVVVVVFVVVVVVVVVGIISEMIAASLDNTQHLEFTTYEH